MKMSEGVEWTAHACVMLAALPPGVGLPAAALAEFHYLAPAYMAKHMQALTRAGVVDSIRGAGGGYRLAKPAADITLWDIVEAIEGGEPPFRCSEIRQQGPCTGPNTDFRKPCEITAVFRKAEVAWRAELKSVSLADIAADLGRKVSPARRAQLKVWLEEKLG
jgi:Rrf2 family protein